MPEGQGGGRGPGPIPGVVRGDSPGDKAREDFFSEAQELVDGLSRDLVALDELSRKGQNDPELVNDVFRAVHTLKGLAGLFGASRMSAVSHELEDVLDDLRLGRLSIRTVDPELARIGDRIGTRLYAGLVVGSLLGSGTLLLQAEKYHVLAVSMLVAAVLLWLAQGLRDLRRGLGGSPR